MSPRAAQPHPVGKWFHSWACEDGQLVMRWQGQVIQMLDPGQYVVQLYSWFLGNESTKEVVSTRAMIGWSFYETADAMRLERTRYVYRSKIGVEPPSRKPRRRPTPDYELRCDTCGCYYNYDEHGAGMFGCNDGDLCLDESGRNDHDHPCPGVVTWTLNSKALRAMQGLVQARPSIRRE